MELGRRVTTRLAADPDFQLTAVDAAALRAAGRDTPTEATACDLKLLLEGAEVLVYLGVSTGPILDGTGVSGVDLELTRELLDAAGDSGLSQVVLLSSAMVYGAWATNPIPITEDAILRPNSELGFAVEKAEMERMASEWREGHPGASVALLRPVVAVSEETTDWMASSSWSPRGVHSADSDPPPVQVVHLDDLAGAIEFAVRNKLDGAFNVAPEGWLPPERLDELAGPGPRLRLRKRAWRRIEAARHRVGLNPTPPEILAYTCHPWVVSADRLRAAGWEPRWSNEEAFVAGHPPSPLDGLSPRRKQELSLAVAALLLLGSVVGALSILRRVRSGPDAS